MHAKLNWAMDVGISTKAVKFPVKVPGLRRCCPKPHGHHEQDANVKAPKKVGKSMLHTDKSSKACIEAVAHLLG